MKKNMGAMDRVVRFFIVLIIGALYGIDMISGWVAIVFGSVAVIFLITSFFSVCPIYMAFGWSTVEKAFSGKKKRRRR
jgi:Inner membrane protein YgaP-like, transmembrane domain